MFVSIGIAILTLVAVGFAIQYQAFRHNLSEARKSGLPYIIAPVYFQSIPWILLQESLLPLLQKLPNALTQRWLPLSLYNYIWHAGYKPFEDVGHDTFIVVSPGGNILWSCDPAVKTQVFSRRLDFPKPVDMMQVLNIYGPTLTASEGEQHIKYKKITSPSFNETTHQAVWNGSIKEADLMTEMWTSSGGLMDQVGTDCSRQALHVLSKVFFNRSISWIDDQEPPLGHKITYNKAASTVFKHSRTYFTTPKIVLKNSPSEAHKAAWTAYEEFGKYMEEMKTETASRLLKQDSSDKEQNVSLLESLVKAGLPKFSSGSSLLTPSEVFGNIFIFILAGHETSANMLAFAIALLAVRKDYQRDLQAEIDTIFPDGVHETTENYATPFHKLWQGYTGALMQEVLRLYTVLPFVPKSTVTPQNITIDDKSYTIPGNTTILMNVTALHTNPKYWPAPNTKKPVGAFMPEQWLDRPTEPNDEYVGPAAYMPFSAGFRSCLGSRFARIEFCASIAKIFGEWSVELADDTPAGVKKVEDQLTNLVKFEMGLKMGQAVSLKLVPRKKT